MTTTIDLTADIIDVRDITADIIDVRDIIARVEELREERDDLAACSAARAALAEWQEENAEELTTLEAILEDLAGNGGDEQWEGDWYPVTLIRDSYFQDYAQELAEDCGFISSDEWPARCIDWEKAADELRQDYTTIDIDGTTYQYR